MRIIYVAFGALLAAPAYAHQTAALDSYGCHANIAHGSYHCHKGPLAGQQFPDRVEMLRALQEQDRERRRERRFDLRTSSR